jgi:hypothetical protein
MGSALLAVCLFRSIAFEPEEIAVMSDRPTTEMPHVGIERFGTGQCKENRAHEKNPAALGRKKRRSVIGFSTARTVDVFHEMPKTPRLQVQETRPP